MRPARRRASRRQWNLAACGFATVAKLQAAIEVIMRLSAKAQYACVAMADLACSYQDPNPVHLKHIADKHGISQRFLVQIMLQLKGAGLVDSTRGVAGGYLLAK